MSASSTKYSKKDPIDHILDRSDMYCGSKKSKKMIEYVAKTMENGDYKITKKEILCSPALLRIFVETLSNAIDNVLRSNGSKTPCTYIKINFDKETGETSVCNDGQVVPIEKNDDGKTYVHSMIFGELLTGSNYNDDEERFTSGKNGIGVKVCNVFSKQFTVKGVDPERMKSFTQTWTENMKKPGKPSIRKLTSKKKIKGYTKITYTPDFERFSLKGYTEDILSLYIRYIIDASMLCSSVKIFINDKLLSVNNLVEYSKLYMTSNEYVNDVLCIKQPNSQIVITPCELREYQEVSFVNGVFTKLGGVHVEAWQDKIFRPLLDKFNKKGKPQINIRDLKQFFRVFVVSTVDKPEFDSQEKHRLEGPNLKLEPVKVTSIKKILKWDICEEIKDIIKGKEMVVMKKVERKKKGFVKIEGLDPANLAGTKHSSDCSLIICEGLSAKTYAVAGIKKGLYGRKGRDYFGCMPLRGKMMNSRNANPTAISKNKEITNLVKALGLNYNVDYTKQENFEKLRYGKVIIICDSDVDGIHIEGLIINTFHFLFPTLLKRKEAYIVSMKTPIVRVFQKPKDLLFYDEENFKDFAKSNPKIKSKYYKGLGTTKNEDVPETFGSKMIEFKADENIDKNINKVFNSKFSNERKLWMKNYSKENAVSLDKVGKNYDMNISDFIDNEMIKFSISDCKRNIPNFVDGFKESQRKILYCAKKRKLGYNSKSLKVAQFGGYVAEHSNYHHGEQNLYETITKMANEFPGTNNIPLLYRDGQFGSRTYGGKDAASARYIFTKMDMLTHLLFRSEDDCLLERNIDDGDEVEPKFYIPILPMILINGCTVGIGTGWSCNVPNYNPIDIIKIIKMYLNEEDISKVEIKPWYRNFKGTVEKVKGEDKKFITKGVIKQMKRKNMYKITELPIGLWTDNFKDKLEDLLQAKKIKDMKNYSTPNIVDIDVKECENNMKVNITNLKLSSYVYTTNMVMFNEEEKLHRFNNPIEVISSFCGIRLNYYTKRKEYLLKTLTHELNILKSKKDFITNVIKNNLKLMNVNESDLCKVLEDKKYYKVEENFEYLLKMPVRTFTNEKVEKLNNDYKNKISQIEIIKNTNTKQMWLNELEEFEKVYPKFIKSLS